MTERHAVYAICRTSDGATVPFRVGQPVDWHTAQARWLRLDDRRRAQRAQRIRWERRGYAPDFFEVRAVDRHGRGLGSERHAQAFPVPYRSLRLL